MTEKKLRRKSEEGGLNDLRHLWLNHPKGPGALFFLLSSLLIFLTLPASLSIASSQTALSETTQRWVECNPKLLESPRLLAQLDSHFTQPHSHRPSPRLKDSISISQSATDTPTRSSVESFIPKAPEIPPRFAITRETPSFGCKRLFAYQGNLYEVDSYHKLDAERLRPILKDVDGAIDELTHYQRVRRNAHTANYVGTVGLGIALLSWIISTQQSSQDAKLTRSIGIGSGLGLTLGSLAYRFTILVRNEERLGKAVAEFNKAYPKEPITLQFSTRVIF